MYHAKQHGLVDGNDPVDIYQLVTGAKEDQTLVLTVEGMGRRAPNIFLEHAVKGEKEHGSGANRASDVRLLSATL